MTQQFTLEPEQKDLLIQLVEASRNVKQEKRQKFLFTQTFSKSEISHPGFLNGSISAYVGDIEALDKYGFLNLQISPRKTYLFDVSPSGFQYYASLKKSSSQPIESVVESVMSYVNSDILQKRFPSAIDKWSQAVNLLWSAESISHLTTIGHLCREAMQEFMASLLEENNIPSLTKDKAHVVARLKTVISNRSAILGGTERALLDALIPYWGTVSDLVQRQEHGGAKEAEPLNWEDGRRVVFQTAIVMYEISRSIEITPQK